MRRIALLAVLLLAGCAQQSLATVPAGPPAAPKTDSPQAITLRVVQRTLAQAPLPSGTRRATAAEATGKQEQSHPADPDLVDRHATYVVPLGFHQAIAWFTAHPPSHLKQDEDSMTRGPQGPIAAGLGFGGRSTAAYDSLAEQVAIYPLDHAHAVVRIDGLAVWRIQPTSDERVPKAATAVQVVRVVRGNARPQRFTLTGGAVARLARELNRQLPVHQGVTSCPSGNGGYDVLHFVGATPDPVFRVEASGCGRITVTDGGVSQPPLGGGPTVDHALHDILVRHR